MLEQLKSNGFVSILLGGEELRLDNDDIEIRLQAKDGWAAAQGSGCVVVLNTEVTEDLRIEGAAKDLIRQIQSRRKESSYEYTDRIEVATETDDAEIIAAIQTHRDQIMSETLSVVLEVGDLEGCDAVETDFGKLFVRKTGNA